VIKIRDDEFASLVSYIKTNYGINLSQKRVLLEGRLTNYLTEQGYGDYTAYINALKADKTGKELTNLLNKVTTNHTYFMRESDHFDYLARNVLPSVERNVRDRDLRFWCAAASSGEEPYTLAMILQDYFGAKTPRWDKKLLATDISLKVLEQAKLGHYSAESVATLPENWRRKYFSKVNDETVQVVPQIKSEVIYRQFNLMDKIVAKKQFHVIFCRNVMIYFDAQTKADLVERMYDVMAPGGYLFIGHTESVAKPTRFNYVMPSVYQKGVI
jgi:chemotaxis protein methyltransferase CheR